MAALGYIEILDGKGGAVERIAVDAFPLTIGRAYTNQVILSDPYACPLHVKIAADEQGRLIASDLDSVNGLFAATAKERIASLELDSGTQFRVGHTLLRYCSVEHPLAPTALDKLATQSALALPHAAVVSGLAVWLLLCVDAYLSSVERVTLAGLVSEPILTMSMLGTWAGMWALGSRLIVNRFNFAQHVTVGCLALLTISSIGVAAEWSEFFFPAIPVLRITGMVGYGLVLAGLVFGHLGFASPLRRRSRLWAALSVSVAVVGSSAITDFAARDKFSNIMEYTGVMKPVDAAWVPATTVDDFVGTSEKLKRDLEKLVQKSKASR